MDEKLGQWSILDSGMLIQNILLGTHAAANNIKTSRVELKDAVKYYD
jgi:hypothetical protein